MNYLAALVVTLVVEALVFVVGLPRLGRVSPRAALAASVLLNLVTHAWAWLVAWRLFEDALGAVPAFVLLEAIVCGVEWRVLRAWRRFEGPLLAALVLLANGASLAAGAALLA